MYLTDFDCNGKTATYELKYEWLFIFGSLYKNVLSDIEFERGALILILSNTTLLRNELVKLVMN